MGPSKQGNRSVSTSSHVITNALGNVAPPLAVLITAPVLARSLGVEGRGELAAVLAPYLLVVAAGTIGLPEAVTQAVARQPQLWRRLSGLSAFFVFLVGAASSALILLADAHWPIVGDGSDATHSLALATSAIVPGLFVSVLRGAALGRNMWTTVTGERIANGLFRAVPIVILSLTGDLTLTTATICMAFGPVLAGIAYVQLFRRRPSGGSGEIEIIGSRQLLGYGLRVWLGSVAGILLMRVDQLMMTFLASTTELGLYAVAVNVSEVPLIVSTAFREVMFTKDAADPSSERLTRAARIALLACGLFGGVVTLSSVVWVPWLFGSDFSGSILPAAILSVAVIIGVPGSVAGSGLSARGRPGLRSISIAVAAAVNLVAIYILVPPMGAVGAALATLLGNLISSNGNLFFLRRYFGVRIRDSYLIRGSDVRALLGLADLLRQRRSGG